MAEAAALDDSQDEARRAALLRQRLFPAAADPIRIGRFALEERVGAGAMGTVYLGRDAQLHRPVAIKVLRKSDGASNHRLLREARALARLTHPNVVTVYEAGEVDGQFYVAMEYVPGQTLAEWQQDKGWERCLGAYRDAGAGLVAVHAAGLVHRDFKPANVLVGEDGRVRVADFGLVRAEGRAETPHAGVGRVATQQTAFGALLGTPAYMAPEQLRGEVADPRSDQFSFCVALWEAVSGARPFVADSVPALHERMKEPPTPGPRRLPGWMEAALRRGLSAKAEDRYPDMESLIAALRPQRPRWPYLVGAASVAGLVGLVAAGVAVTLPDDPLPDEPPPTVDASQVDAARSLLDSDPTTAALLLLETGSDLPGWSEVALQALTRPVIQARRRPEQYIPIIGFDADGNLEGYAGQGRFVWSGSAYVKADLPLATRVTGAPRPPDAEARVARVRAAHRGRCYGYGFLPDGTLRWLGPDAVYGYGPDGEQRARVPYPNPEVEGIAVRESGGVLWLREGVMQILAVDASEWRVVARGVAGTTGRQGGLAIAYEDEGASIWVGGELRPLLGMDGAIRTLDASPDGNWIVGISEGRAFVWEVDDDPDGFSLPGKWSGRRPIFVGRDKLVLFGTQRGPALWDLRNRRSVDLPRADREIIGADWHPGAGFVTSSLDGIHKFWNLDGLEGVWLGAHERGVWSGAFDARNNRVATAGTDGTVRVVHVRGEEPTLTLGVGTDANFYHTAFSDDGGLLAAGAGDGTARLWSMPGGSEPRVFPGHATWAYALGFSPDGRWLATGDRAGNVRRFPVRGGEGELLGTHPSGNNRIHTLSYAPDGAYVASGAKDGSVLLFSTAGENPTLLEEGDFNPVVAHDRAGNIVTVGRRGEVRFSRPDGTLVRSFDVGGAPTGWAFEPDGPSLAVATANREVRWFADGGEIVHVPPGDRVVEALAVEPGGARMACGDDTGRVRVFDRKGKEIWTFSGHATAVRFVAFSGPYLVSAGADGTIRRWDTPRTNDEIAAALRRRTTLCLTTGLRRRFLGESPEVADRAARACEARRTP